MNKLLFICLANLLLLSLSTNIPNNATSSAILESVLNSNYSSIVQAIINGQQLPESVSLSELKGLSAYLEQLLAANGDITQPEHQEEEATDDNEETLWSNLPLYQKQCMNRCMNTDIENYDSEYGMAYCEQYTNCGYICAAQNIKAIEC